MCASRERVNNRYLIASANAFRGTGALSAPLSQVQQNLTVLTIEPLILT